MSDPRKTAIVTGASQGIGAGIVKGFVERGFNVVANSRKVTQRRPMRIPVGESPQSLHFCRSRGDRDGGRRARATWR